VGVRDGIYLDTKSKVQYSVTNKIIQFFDKNIKIMFKVLLRLHGPGYQKQQ